MNFYKHHIGDYDADTQHLSWDEDAAYRRLISLYCRREEPIPADVKEACRLVRATTKAQRAAVSAVLAEFFVLGPDGWRNKRCDEEIFNASKKADANRENGKKGGRPSKKAPKTEPTGFQFGSDSLTQQNLSQTPDSRLQSSVAIATAADAAPAAPDLPEITARERVWSLGVPLLGDGARGLLGRLVKAHGEEVVAEVLAEATLNPPVDPRSWVVAACAKRAQQPKANGHHPPGELDGDPKPAWAIRAGFPDRFQAQNAGCGPGNARQFRNGERVAA